MGFSKTAVLALATVAAAELQPIIMKVSKLDDATLPHICY
jgi:hypothetical protein